MFRANTLAVLYNVLVNAKTILDNSLVSHFFEKFRNLLDDYIVNYRIKYLFFFLFIFFFAFEMLSLYFLFVEFIGFSMHFVFNYNNITDEFISSEVPLFFSYLADLSLMLANVPVLTSIIDYLTYFIGFWGYLLEMNVTVFFAVYFYLSLYIIYGSYPHIFAFERNSKIIYLFVLYAGSIFTYLLFNFGMSQSTSYIILLSSFSIISFFCLAWTDKMKEWYGVTSYGSIKEYKTIITIISDLLSVLFITFLFVLLYAFFYNSVGYIFVLGIAWLLYDEESYIMAEVDKADDNDVTKWYHRFSFLSWVGVCFSFFIACIFFIIYFYFL
jgi:hypothetical protein